MKKILFIFLGLITAACVRQNSGPSLESSAMQYLGAAYILDPLGEGYGAPHDQDPIRRIDAFDCLTFVETVLADNSSEDLQKIRYAGGEIDWFRRNHWTEKDWIPNAMALELIMPIEYGHSAKTFARVNLRRWYKEKVGVEPLVKSGWNLTEAEAEFGINWLSK